MIKIREYNDVEVQEIASGALLPSRNKYRDMELSPEPTKLLPDTSWMRKTIEELEKEGRIDSEEHWTPNLVFDGDPKFLCRFKTELSGVTKIQLLNAINDMMEKRLQDLIKPPCSIEVTEGDDENHVKIHIIFDSATGIDRKKGE